jgi:hypothetical protein
VEVFQYFMLEDTVLWDVTLHSVAAWWECFRATYCLHLKYDGINYSNTETSLQNYMASHTTYPWS